MVENQNDQWSHDSSSGHQLEDSQRNQGNLSQEEFPTSADYSDIDEYEESEEGISESEDDGPNEDSRIEDTEKSNDDASDDEDIDDSTYDW